MSIEGSSESSGPNISLSLSFLLRESIYINQKIDKQIPPWGHPPATHDPVNVYNCMNNSTFKHAVDPCDLNPISFFGNKGWMKSV